MGYLIVDEQATTLNIKTDAAPFFEIEFDEAKGGVIDVWYQGDGGSTNYANTTNGLLSHYCLLDASYRRQHTNFGSACVMTVLEKGPLRVHVRFTVDLYTNLTLEQNVYVYPSGYIHVHNKVTNNTGVAFDSADRTGANEIRTDATNYASDTQIADNSNDLTPTYNTEYWFAHYATSLSSVIVGVVEATGDGQQDSYYGEANLNLYWNDSPTLANGASYEQTLVLYIGGTAATAGDIEDDIKEYKAIGND